ncbi:DNA polymerase III subunit gamma/tau [Hyalangium versicolor]|uniref:DNA polymerase III subunit gamma/tau n=1 Tax=Hyalangium versicolor TaxID=2861190 RepID=UPI001CCDDA2F|nr:DNA polymerase III subunit gamma/tau [Hyalangium versicolor]
MRVTNVRKPAEAMAAAAEDERLFPEEGSAEGCASGECLPDAAPAAEPEPEPDPASPPVIHGRDNPGQAAAERWRAAVDSVKAASARHGAALAHGRLLWLRAGEVGVAYVAAAAFHKGQVMGATGKALVEKALTEHFGRPTRLVVEEATGEAANTLSIAEVEAQARTAHHQSTEGKVRSHPSIRAVLKILGGEIEHIQVLEPERPPAGPTVETPEESA